MAAKVSVEEYHGLAELELEAAATADDSEAKKAHLDQAAIYALLAERASPGNGSRCVPLN